MNKETLDATGAREYCDAINLHEFTLIQPYGVLFILDQHLSIRYYSANTAELLSTAPDELKKKSITHFLTARDAKIDVGQWLQKADSEYQRLCWQTTASVQSIVVYIRRNTDRIILEVEPEQEDDVDDLFETTQFVNAKLRAVLRCNDLQAMAQMACAELQQITGFDRVIMYQFDEHDQSGVVIGEVHTEGMASYMGARFPANDIPQPVREMYRTSLLRYIPSIQAAPVKILAVNSDDLKENIPFGHLNLRMVAPIHAEYLQNMGVKAATSVAILYEDRLWGLIACHHRTEKYLGLSERLILVLIANTLTSKILALEYSEDYQEEQRALELQSMLAANFNKVDSLSKAIDNYYRELLELVTAHGMSVYFENSLLNYGETPAHVEVLELIAWLQEQQRATTFITTSLPSDYPASISYKNKACGMIAIKLTALTNFYILFYKPELVTTITWAGNPNEALTLCHSSYSPRTSFQQFLQTVHNQSTPWRRQEIRSAEFIRSIIANKQLQDMLQSQVMHDPLTKLLNRFYLEQRLAAEMQRASREQNKLAVMLVDVDHFKRINDTFGHQAGDLVLVNFAELLMNIFRAYDGIYRYGGEEFLILMPVMDEMVAKQKAETLREETKNLRINFNGQILPSIAISAGIAFAPEHDADPKSLITAADHALYQAKQAGRDQVVIAKTH